MLSLKQFFLKGWFIDVSFYLFTDSLKGDFELIVVKFCFFWLQALKISKTNFILFKNYNFYIRVFIGCYGMEQS